MTVVVALCCVAVLLALACLAVAVGRSRRARPIVYGACLVVSLAVVWRRAAMCCSAAPLAPPSRLPLGLPWLGAHFRLDALAAFFLAVVNLGAAAASLFALGYGRHEEAPQRVLPFYPAFLAGMNLVVLADDAFTLPGRRGSSCRSPPGRW